MKIFCGPFFPKVDLHVLYCHNAVVCMEIFFERASICFHPVLLLLEVFDVSLFVLGLQALIEFQGVVFVALLVFSQVACSLSENCH